MKFRGERREYYKRRRCVIEVSTCACCKIDGMQDAWFHEPKRPISHCGVSKVYLDDWTLITRAEAEKLVARLGQELVYDAEETPAACDIVAEAFQGVTKAPAEAA